MSVTVTRYWHAKPAYQLARLIVPIARFKFRDENKVFFVNNINEQLFLFKLVAEVANFNIHL
jgi:hypothetical protein